MHKHEILDIAAGASVSLPAIAASLRVGSLRRAVTIAADPAVVRLVAGLNYLVEYPYGCTEQRISLCRLRHGPRSVKPFQPLLAASNLEARVSNDVHNTMIAIGQSIGPDGLVAFWPRARGNVSLTASAYSFLVAARQAGEPVDKALMDRLAARAETLAALRLLFAAHLAGEEMRERVEALTALAAGGKLDEGYAAELARRADQMPNASVAQMASVVARMPRDDRRIVEALLQDMWSRVKFSFSTAMASRSMPGRRRTMATPRFCRPRRRVLR